MISPNFGGQKPTMFICGDSAEARPRPRPSSISLAGRPPTWAPSRRPAPSSRSASCGVSRAGAAGAGPTRSASSSERTTAWASAPAATRDTAASACYALPQRSPMLSADGSSPPLSAMWAGVEAGRADGDDLWLKCGCAHLCDHRSRSPGRHGHRRRAALVDPLDRPAPWPLTMGRSSPCPRELGPITYQGLLRFELGVIPAGGDARLGHARAHQRGVPRGAHGEPASRHRPLVRVLGECSSSRLFSFPVAAPVSFPLGGPERA